MADKKTTAKTTKATKPAAKKATKKPVTETKDLHQALADKQSDLATIKRSHRSGELVNPRALREHRRDIARLKTAIRANELGKEK